MISETEAGQRLDRFLKKTYRQAPLSLIYRWIRTAVRVNGRRAELNQKLATGDCLTIAQPPEALAELEKPRPHRRSRRSFGIAYEDDRLLVVEKPFGLLTHGTDTEKKDTLANQVLAYLIETKAYQPGRGVTFVPAPANRLDRNTTGLVLFGKDYETTRYLAALLQGKTGLSKYYVTIVSGQLLNPLELTGSLEKDAVDNRVSIGPAGGDGKHILTRVRPLCAGERFSLVEIELITGRSHQIRAHLAAAGYPLIGDPKYGKPAINHELRQRFGISTQLLHAWRLEFGEVIGPLADLAGQTVVSAWPEQLVGLAQTLTGAQPETLPGKPPPKRRK